MSDQTLATDRECLEIEMKARSTKVMHWPELVRVINRMRAAEAQLAKLDEAHAITQQGLWQDITELRASCARLRETKDTFFRKAEAWETRALAAEAQFATMRDTLRTVRQHLIDGQGEEDVVLIIDAALALKEPEQ